jgi:hypothetical protein
MLMDYILMLSGRRALLSVEGYEHASRNFSGYGGRKFALVQLKKGEELEVSVERNSGKVRVKAR